MKKRYYCDYAATTPMAEIVIKKMLPFYNKYFQNPSAAYYNSENIRNQIEKARHIIADSLSCKASEIYFTSGGTESDNWAIRGVMLANKEKGNHIVCSSIEHPAVLNTCHFLEKNGYEVTYLPVDREGFVSCELLEKNIKRNTTMVSIMYANNEIGTVQNIAGLSEIANKHGCIFHTDAVQAYCHIPINLSDSKVDLLSASSHKIYGPKGCGFLYIKDGIKADPLLYGGSQEKNIRAGTYYVAGIIGMAAAVEFCMYDLSKEILRETKIRDYISKRLLNEIPFTKLNGDKEKRLSNNINISFKNIEGESLLILLDLKGIEVSNSSACSALNHRTSHVIQALGVDSEYADGTIRITIGSDTNLSDADYIVNSIKECVYELRKYTNKIY